MSNFKVFQDIENLASRNEMTSVLVDFFSPLGSKESQIYTYLLQGRVAPLFVSKEFHFSEKSVLKVLGNLNENSQLGLDILKMRDDLGDIGLVAEEVCKKLGLKESKRDIFFIYEKLWEIILISGLNSVTRKSDVLSSLLLSSTPLDAKYLVRIVSGKLRLGCSDKTFLDAYSFILTGDKSSRNILDSAYGVISDLGYISSIVNSNVVDRVEVLKNVKPILGIPIFPRLVGRVGSLEEAIERFGNGSFIQPKFDGLRCQIHKGVKSNDFYNESVWYCFVSSESEPSLFSPSNSSNVKIFSRNLNDITDMFPDVVDAVMDLDCDSCILDGEIIGWDEENSSFVPFQDTMTRKRKYGVSDKVKLIPVRYFVFDVLFLNGRDLMTDDLSDRLGCLNDLIVSGSDLISRSDSVIFDGDVSALDDIFSKYVGEGLEGIIVKKKDGGYLPGVRNFDWVKIKRSIDSRVVDTIDAVVLGYYYGSGRKTKFGMGSLLIGVYNEVNDTFESVGKVGTGIKDSDWENISVNLERIKIKKNIDRVVSNLIPSVWVNPEIVVTVECDEISKSSVHTAGNDLLGFGLSLRFPRLKFFGRDKLPEDCTSVSELINMWKMKKY